MNHDFAKKMARSNSERDSRLTMLRRASMAYKGPGLLLDEDGNEIHFEDIDMEEGEIDAEIQRLESEQELPGVASEEPSTLYTEPSADVSAEPSYADDFEEVPIKESTDVVPLAAAASISETSYADDFEESTEVQAQESVEDSTSASAVVVPVSEASLAKEQSYADEFEAPEESTVISEPFAAKDAPVSTSPEEYGEPHETFLMQDATSAGTLEDATAISPTTPTLTDQTAGTPSSGHHSHPRKSELLPHRPSPSPVPFDVSDDVETDTLQSAEEDARRAAATQKIQNISRGRAARKRVEEIRVDKKQEDERREAATQQIQNIGRGRAARKRVEQLRADNRVVEDEMPGTAGPEADMEQPSLASGQHENMYSEKVDDTNGDTEIVTEDEQMLDTLDVGEKVVEGKEDTPTGMLMRSETTTQKPNDTALALDMTNYKSPYEVMLSKESKAKKRSGGSHVNQSVSMASLHGSSADPRNSSQSIFKSGSRGSRRGGSHGKTMSGSISTSAIPVNEDGYVTLLSNQMVSADNRKMASANTEEELETAEEVDIPRVDGEASIAAAAGESPMYERIVEMRSSISNIKDRFKALKQISMLDKETALEGGWTEKDIKGELVKLKKELAREREKLKVTLQSGAHRLGGKTNDSGAEVVSAGYAPNLSAVSDYSSKARDRLFSDDVALKLKKLCSTLDRHCKARDREIAREKRGWVKPLTGKLSPVLSRYKPTFDRNPVAPLFRGSSTDVTGGREIGFIPRTLEPLSVLQARYDKLAAKVKNTEDEDVDDNILQQMWTLEVNIAEATRAPRYKAQGKSLKNRMRKEYMPVRRGGGR